MPFFDTWRTTGSFFAVNTTFNLARIYPSPFAKLKSEYERIGLCTRRTRDLSTAAIVLHAALAKERKRFFPYNPRRRRYSSRVASSLVGSILIFFFFLLFKSVRRNH